MKCARCGFDNPAGLEFCGQCGAALAAKPEEALTAAEIDHLRSYLPAAHVEALDFAPVSPSPSLLEQSLAHLSALFQNLGAHLPTYVVESVARQPQPGQASGQFVIGALLFADVSGFTAMSERLSRIGREGAEEITSIINRYFGVMLAILREHDGQLIQFGGDALLGLFLEPGSAAHATQAALKMQAAMADFRQIQTSQGVFPLQMKVGIHCGRFFAAQLGLARRMTYALVGADVNATAATESAAVAGQVLLDRATFESLTLPGLTASPSGERYVVVAPDESAPPLAAADQASGPASDAPAPRAAPTLTGLRQAVARLDALIPYLPADLLTRVTGGPGVVAQEGEHRLVGVLFANVHGLGEIADRLGPGQEARIVAALNHYFAAMETGIHRFGGVVNKIDLYDHGDKLLAFFGAPVAHEDDAERAVRAALAMQDTLAEVNATLADHTGLPDLRLSQQIGISYGYVFAGYVGTDWRREYTVMGDDVNLAARLMSVAEPGNLIVSSNVRRQAQAFFEFTARGEERLKGKAEPVHIFTVAGPRAEPEVQRAWSGVRSPIVGRRAEFEQLLSATLRLLEGRGQVVSIIGEAGLGKSRLADEVREHLLRQPNAERWAGRWFEGRCLSYTESASFWPFQELVRRLAGIHQDDDKAEAGAKLRAAFERHLQPEAIPVTLPYLTNFLGLPLDEAQQEKVRYLDAEALQRRTFMAIGGLIEAFAPPKGAPLALALEDIHWIDQASRALLEYLLPLVNRTPLMFILLYRPERAKVCWQIREKVARNYTQCATEINLHPLTPADSRELLVNLAQTAHWPAEAYERILSRTEGNPLYMEELIRGLIDDNALYQDVSGQWRLRSLESLKVPDNLQGMLMARLDRLEEPPRQTAQVASVVGRLFAFNVLAHIYDGQRAEAEARLSENLARLQQHEIVFESRRVPELIYAFKHGMMQEVYYASLLARTSRRYHRKIAEYLQTQLPADEAETNAALVAHHAFVGQDWPLALRYKTLAGQQAQRLFANSEAIDHFSKALHSAEQLPSEETPEPRQAIHAALGEILTTTGKYEPALEHLSQARALAIERSDRNAEARACRWVARLHELRGEYPPAFDWIQRGLGALGERETPEAAQLRLIAGLIHSRQGDNERALEQCQSALRIAQDLGELTALARAYLLLGHIHRLRGSSATAVEHFQRALDLYLRAGDLSGQATAHNQMGNAYFDASQYSAADRAYRQARDTFKQMGDIYNGAFADSNLGEIALNQGRLDDALASYQAALQAMEQIGGSSYVLGALHNNLGATFLRRGNVEAALEHLRAGQSYFEQAQSRDFLPELRRHFAEAALLAGDLPEAEAQAEQALSLARELEMRSQEGISLRVLGEIAGARREFAQAEERLRASLAIFEDIGEAHERARSWLALAHVHAASGKPAEAAAALGECEAVFQRLDAALDLADARRLRERLEDWPHSRGSAA